MEEQQSFSEAEFKKLVAKVEEMKKSGGVDLSMEEDLSIAIMNLVSLEEHFFFTAQKTGKDQYLDYLQIARSARKELLGRMVSVHEGETWCICKHLLAATMRTMEVATKLQADGKSQEAKKTFDLSYQIYSLFWAIRLKLIDLQKVKKIEDGQINNKDTNPKDPANWTLGDIVSKLVDCCHE